MPNLRQVVLRKVDFMNLCPNCGYDLVADRPVSFGNIAITERDEIVFEGRTLHLSRCQRRVVDALVRARGRGVTRSVLAERVGGDLNDNSIVKYVERVRQSFRAVDPAFDQVIALRGFGAYRWCERRAS